MSEWEIISELRAPQTMPPPMLPPAAGDEWEVVSEREVPNAMPPPTASGEWEIVREEPMIQSAWAPSLDTVTIPEYQDIDPYAYADLKPSDIVGEQAPRRGDSVPVALGKAVASAIPAWGKAIGGAVRTAEEASLGTPLTLPSDIAATVTSPLKGLKDKEYEGVDEFGQPMKMSLDWLSAVPEAYNNFAGWIRKKLPDIMNAPIIGSAEKAMGLDKSIGQTTGEYWSGIEKQWQPDVEKGSLLADVTGAVSSVAQVAPGIVASIITRNPNIALNTFFAITLGQTYEDIREKKPNLAPSQALAGGIISGAAEKYTEKLPLEALLNPKWGFWKRLFTNMGLEVPGEEIATIVQAGIVEKATTNPDMTLKEFLQMLRDTAIQTVIATPIQTTIAHPLIKYVERQEKKIAERERQQTSQLPTAPISPENLRWLVENREMLGLSDDDVAPYLKTIENATPRPTEELSAAREKMKAGEATPQEVIEAYASKLEDIAGLMQEKEATALEARRGRYGTPGQTALDFGTAGTPLFDETTQTSPATEKTQPAATSEAEGAQMFYHGTAAAEEAKPGKVKNIDEAVLEALAEGDVDETIKAEAEKAKSEGYRYLQFEHPDAFGEKDFTATISLYPKEDLKVNKPAALKEQEALRQRYFDQQAAEIKPAAEYGETQKLVLSGGPPAVGKTSMIEKAGVDKSRAVVVNSDDVKALAGKEADNAFHEESSRIANDLLEYAIDSGRNTIYDSQLTNFAKADAQIKKVLGNGGYADIFFINASAETAKARSLARHAKGQSKRIPPDEAIVKGHNYGLPTFIELYKRYKDNPKVHFALWDNDVDFRPVEDRVVFVKDAKGLQVLNNDLFDKLMNTAYNGVEGGKKYVRKDKITERDLQAQIHQIRGRSERLGREKLKRPALGGSIEEQRDTAPSGLSAPQATVSGAAPSPNLPEGKVNEPEKEYRENAGIAAQAVSELGKPTLLQRIKALSGFGMRDRGRIAGGEPVRVPGQEAGGTEGSPRRIVTLGKTISDLKELKSVRLRGTEAPTWNAVYSALRIVRNANVEVMHILYRGKTSGTILYNEAYSCRLPGSVENVSPSLLSLNAIGEANKLSRLHGEEVEIILAHNHPSGDVTVSNADRKFTKEAAAAVAMAKGNFAGHIVINHNKYSLVDDQGNAYIFDLPDVPEEYRSDPLLTMPVPYQALGERVTAPDHIALIAKDINRGEHYFTVLLRSGTKIRGIVNVPLDILTDKDAATEFIRELAVQHGAQDVFAYRENFTNEQRATLGRMTYENTFRDVVEETGSATKAVPINRNLLFGKNRAEHEAQRLGEGPQEVKGEGAVRQVSAWHGGRPLVGGRFNTKYIGTGEGNQAFGWGLYFSGLEDIGRYYAEKLGYGADIAINGKPLRKGDNTFLAALSSDLAQATILTSNTKAKQVAQIYIDSAIDRLENNLPYTGTKAEQAEALEYLKSMGRVESIEKKHSRNLYKVTLHKGKQPGEYTWLDWYEKTPQRIWHNIEAQLRKEREYPDDNLNYIKGKIQSFYADKWSDATGAAVYDSLADALGSQKAASLFLLRAGIDGIRYPAGSLSGINTDAFNYVVFDENAVTVEEHAVYEKEGEYGDTKAEIEAEIKDILNTAKKNGTLGKAPNGKKSNLNDRQWAMVRTRRFKEWFGDWEAAAYIQNTKEFIDKVTSGKRPENIIVGYVSGKAAGRIKQLTGVNVKNAPFELVANDVFHALKDHGDAQREARRTPPQEALTAKDLEILPFVLSEPSKIDMGTIQDGRKSVVFQKKINGTLFAAEIVPSAGGSMLFKTAWKRPSEKADALLTPDHTPEAVPSPSHSYGVTIQAMLEKVKNSSKVVDENGEPLVVYHGSPSRDIEVFNDYQSGRFYFSNKKEVGEWWARESGQVYNVFLSLKNPLIVDYFKEHGHVRFDAASIEGIERRAKSERRDGIIIKSISDYDGALADQYVAFSPTQIKSATGNIGTFDKTDSNILKEEEAPYGEEEEEDDSFDFGANIEKAIEENPEKHISLDFKDHLEGYIGHLFNMVVAGEPGKSLTLEGMGGQDQVISWGSTYPEFMKDQGWSAREVLAALKHAQKGEKTTDRQKEIIRAAIHQATDMFFEDMDRWAPNLSEEAWEKMEASVEPAIDHFLSKYYREKREREIERQKIARITKITKSQYAWEREKQKAKESAWMKGFKSRQEEIEALKTELAKTESKLQTQIAHVKKMFAGEKVKEDAWKEAERIRNTEIKQLQKEVARLKDRLAKAKEEAAPKPKAKRMSRKGQIRIVTGQVLADDEVTLREMDALKDQIRMEAATAREAYRTGKKAGLAAARARYQLMKDILRIKQKQRADIRKMIKQMKDTAKKADQLPPEYKLAITDLLEPWDMARLTDQHRVKLQAIRNEMENNKDADFPPSMLETLKRLDKRPIRDLSYDEIQAIHQAVMHFATLGKNKIKGMAAQQKIVREMTRGVVKGEMKEAETDTGNYDIRYSDEKKIKGFLQKAKNQFGIHLVAWEALVESVSGPRSMFYKVIYRMVKEGALLRDKIMYELEDAFLKAQEMFQQKHGIKDIADWLDADRKIEYAAGKTITMSRNQLISLELGWRDADWRRSVEEGGFGLWNNPMPNDPNKVYKLGPEGIEKIIAAVTPIEREYADMAEPIIQKTGDMLAEKFLEINGYEMPRTESGAYWRKDVMASERGQKDEQTELEKARLGRPGIFKGMTIQRTGSSAAVWLKPFTVAMREMSKRTADYVALEEPISLAAWLMYNKEFRKEFDRRYGMPLWKEIEQGLKDISDVYQPVKDTTWERVGTWLRNKSTLFALGLNYATMLKQFNGAINYLVYVDPVHLANAIVKYGTNRNDVRHLHKQMSTEYRHRREEGYSQDVGNVISSLSATGQKPSLVTRIGVAGMRPLQAIDIFGVDIGMLAAVDQALDAFKAGKITEDMKDALDMTDDDIKNMTYAEQFEAAYKWADYCTERTQSMSRPEHMSGWQRGNEFEKQFSMFMGEVQKNLTGLYRAYNKLQRGDIGAKMHLIKNILLYLIVSSFMIDAGVNAMRDVLRGRRPDRWWAVGLKAITSPIPIVRDVTQTVVDTVQGKVFGLSGGDTPIARFQESIAKAVVKGTKATTAKTAKKRKEAAKETAIALMNTAALATGLPVPALEEPVRIAKRKETARKQGGLNHK